jgi:hypothetical protein
MRTLDDLDDDIRRNLSLEGNALDDVRRMKEQLDALPVNSDAYFDLFHSMVVALQLKKDCTKRVAIDQLNAIWPELRITPATYWRHVSKKLHSHRRPNPYKGSHRRHPQDQPHPHLIYRQPEFEATLFFREGAMTRMDITAYKDERS